MAPTMLVSVLLAGGLKKAIARCVATSCPRMRCVSVVCLPWVVTSSRRKTGLSWQGSCSKQELPGILTACSILTAGYQLSNDHTFRSFSRMDDRFFHRAVPRELRSADGLAQDARQW